MKLTKSNLIVSVVLSALTCGMHIFMSIQSDKVGWLRVVIFSLIYTALYVYCAYLPASKYIMSAWTIFNLAGLFIYQKDRIKTIENAKFTISWDDFINLELFTHLVLTVIFCGGFLIITAIILRIIKRLTKSEN
ncbi:MAG: hypothetical protein A2Y15_07090 [Clostridiales bacterium GWF2_36_10]|nr:MAG: hypothetical protein A2Y15_07090 [Clostridiales bacterium GWF2_36_10]HAN21349.1 hypothetical protein [Clostridiales bacterium]